MYNYSVMRKVGNCNYINYQLRTILINMSDTGNIPPHSGRKLRDFWGLKKYVKILLRDSRG